MATAKITISQELLRSLFDYAPETGVLTWASDAKSNRAKAGQEAGYISTHIGYRYVGIGKQMFLAHRLIWLLEYGHLPKVVDHINRDKTDNRLANLRAADKRLNAYNSKVQSNNKSGYRGVSWDKTANKWVSTFHRNGRKTFIGLFDTADEAAAAYGAVYLSHAGYFAGDLAA